MPRDPQSAPAASPARSPFPRAMPPGGALADPTAEALRRRRISRTNRARAVSLTNSHANLRHGVYSEVAIREDVQDELAMLYARAPWLDQVRDGLIVEATGRLIVRLRKLDTIADAAAAKGLPVLTAMYCRLEAQLTRNLDALGLTPTAAARLGLSTLDARIKAARISERTLDQYRPTKAIAP